MAAAASPAAAAGQLPQATGGGGGGSSGGKVGVGNPAYIVAVVVVVGCVLGLVWVALRKTVCSRDRRGRGRGQVRDAPAGGGPPPSPIYLRGLLFGNPGLSPTASPFRSGSSAGMPPPPPPSSAYRPWAAAPAAADGAGATPRRGLLIDVPLAGSPTLLDEAALKQLLVVTYRGAGAGAGGRQHRRQGSSGVSASGRFGDDKESSKESYNNKESSRDRDLEHGGGGSFSEGCSVCLSAFADGESVRVLPDCGHMFHLDCVDPWLLAHAASCPLCRAEVTGTARGCGGGPGAKRLAKLLARFGAPGRSFRCSSRSFSGSLRDLGSSFRSRLGSDHGSFRARLGADQQQHQDGGDAGGTTRSQRFFEIDLGHHSPRDARPQDSPLRPLRTADHAAAASGSQDTDPAPGGAGTAQQPPSPAGLRHLRLPSSTDVVATGGDDNSTTPRLGSSRTPRSLQQPLSPGGRVDI